MEFPHIGEHCSENSCNRFDFLPMKCDACKSIFCAEHITYKSHLCPSAYKKDVQVPVCPLCNNPVPGKRGDPPDIAVGLHMDNDCQADLGKERRKIFSNKCSSKGCKIKEIVQVKCSDCGDNYCLKHRHPTDHNCVGKEEAMRIRRLNALGKKGPSVKTQTNINGNSQNFVKNVQGTLSEDEALARALQASLEEEGNSRRQNIHPVPSRSRDGCELS